LAIRLALLLASLLLGLSLAQQWWGRPSVIVWVVMLGQTMAWHWATPMVSPSVQPRGRLLALPMVMHWALL
jgi:hypothetical protein